MSKQQRGGVLLLLLSALVWALARSETVNINSMEDFEHWVKNSEWDNGDDVVLFCDLDFNETTMSLLPLGVTSPSSSKYFYGTFDGQNHSIRNAVLGNEKTNYIGLFGALYRATVKNLVIESSCSFVGALSVGTVAGSANSGFTLENVHNHASATGKYAGGLVGGLSFGDKLSRIDHCSNSGTITATNPQSVYGSGGMVGVLDNSLLEIRNSYNTGTIVGGVCSAGGLVGIMKRESTVSVHNCLNRGSITSTGNWSFGIAQTVVNSTNTVSIGKVEGATESDSHALWLSCTGESTNVFVQQGTSPNDHEHAGAKVFTKQCDEGSDCSFVFEDNGAAKRVDHVLNEDVVVSKQQDGSAWLFWNKSLEQVEQLNVSCLFGPPASKAVEAGIGTALEAVVAQDAQVQQAAAGKHLVDRGTGQEIAAGWRVLRDMDVALCHSVAVTGVAAFDVLVEHGQPLSTNKKLEELFADGELVVVDTSSGSAVDGTMAAITDMELCATNRPPAHSSSSTASPLPSATPSSSTDNNTSSSPSTTSSSSSSSSDKTKTSPSLAPRTTSSLACAAAVVMLAALHHM